MVIDEKLHCRQEDSVEENLFVYYRLPLSDDANICRMPVSNILTRLTIYVKEQVNRQILQELVQALAKYGFNSLTNQHGGMEYKVVAYWIEKVEKKFRGSRGLCCVFSGTDYADFMVLSPPIAAITIFCIVLCQLIF